MVCMIHSHSLPSRPLCFYCVGLVWGSRLSEFNSYFTVMLAACVSKFSSSWVPDVGSQDQTPASLFLLGRWWAKQEDRVVTHYWHTMSGILQSHMQTAYVQHLVLHVMFHYVVWNAFTWLTFFTVISIWQTGVLTVHVKTFFTHVYLFFS